MNDINVTYLTEKEIIRLLDDRLLGSLDSVISLIDVSLGVLAIGITIFLVITGLKSRKIREVIDDMKDNVSFEIDKRFYIESKIIEESFQRKLTKNLKFYMKEYQVEAQKEEFIRNVIFKNLSELLADEIRVNGESNLKEVFNLYSDRLYLVSQLTSNNEKEVKKSLKKLSTGTYDKILRLEAFNEYLNILEKKTNMDIGIELYEVGKIILTNK